VAIALVVVAILFVLHLQEREERRRIGGKQAPMK
jgi:hypothetical protein